MSDGAQKDDRKIRFLADQNLRQAIVDGLLLQRPGMDIALVKDVGLLHRPDPEILTYCKEDERLLLSHDQRTMSGHLDDLLQALPVGEHHPGGFVIPQHMATGEAIEAILLVWEARDPEEWLDRLTFLPL